MTPLFIIGGVGLVIVGLNAGMILANILRRIYCYLRLRPWLNDHRPLP